MTTAAPAAPAPVAAPVAAAPAPVAAPAAATAAAPAAVAAPAAEPAAATSLLGDAKAEPKPGEVTGAAPETYADFTMPEGIAPDPKALDAFKATAKALGLSQEGAQKLVTLQAEHAKLTATNLVAQAEKQAQEARAKWKAETQTALGSEWQKELGYAGKALDAFGGAEKGKEIRELLTASGLGDHPLVAKMLVAIGKAMSEAQPGNGARVDLADPKEAQYRSMFPKMYNEDGSKKF